MHVDRADGRVTMQVTAPDTITSWVASAFAVSSDVGLGVAPDAARVSVCLCVALSFHFLFSLCRAVDWLASWSYSVNSLILLTLVKLWGIFSSATKVMCLF